MHEIHAWKKKQAQNDMNLQETLLKMWMQMQM